MTNLKFTIALDNDAILKITDTTGFVNTDATGFALQDETNIPIGSYKLSDGYFIDVITYNKYNAEPIIVLKSDYVKVTQLSTTYASNFKVGVYKLTQDSIYTAMRIFIMTKEFYNAERLTGRFANKTVYYSDGTAAYKVVSGTPVKIELKDLINSSKLDTTILFTSNTFIGTVYMNMCYYRLMQLIIKDGYSACDQSSLRVKEKDFLYMSLEVIKYLKSLGNITEIQKVIESMDLCGGLCKSLISNSNCGCNG